MCISLSKLNRHKVSYTLAFNFDVKRFDQTEPQGIFLVNHRYYINVLLYLSISLCIKKSVKVAQFANHKGAKEGSVSESNLIKVAINKYRSWL